MRTCRCTAFRKVQSYIDNAKADLKKSDEYRVLVSSAFADKTGIQKGEKLELDDKYRQQDLHC